MLPKSAVEPATLDLLKALMLVPELSDFYLVGGTALALRYSHRLSVDLDLFATKEFETDLIIAALSKNFPSFTYRNNRNPVGIFGYINDVKVDLVRQHHFKVISDPLIIDGIRSFGDQDIMAMKIFAMLQRAAKKDFWDVAELLQHYKVDDFINAYTRKYPDNQMLISIPHAMTYFMDAEDSPDPISLKGQTWPKVKKVISKAISEYLK